MEIKEKIKKGIPNSNLTKNETDILQQLSQRDDIIITKVDKGGARKELHIREVNRQLNNTGFYKKISNDPTESNRNKVNNTINEFKLQRLADIKMIQTAKMIQTQQIFKPLKQEHQTSICNQNPQTRQSREASY